MTDSLAQYLQRIELKNSIPKEIEKLKRRELEINLYLFLFGGFAVSAHFYPQLYFVSNTDHRWLILFMLVWFYIQFEYKYFVASIDLAAKIKRRKTLRESLNLDPEEAVVSLKNEKKEDTQVVMEQSDYMHNAYSNFITN